MSLSAFIWSVLAGILATVFVGATYVIKRKKNAGIVQKERKTGVNKSKNVNISIKGDKSE